MGLEMTAVAGAGTCAIAVIAKVPRPGHVKTRLHGLLSPAEAAELGTVFLRDTLGNLAQAAHAAPIAPVVAYAPAGEEARFDGLVPSGTTLLLADGSAGEAQGVAGFGRVLLHTVRALLAQGFGAACVLGADSPTLPTAELARAAHALLRGSADAALGAVEDGGYYLLGLRQAHEAPFRDIAWSTETVAADTRLRLREAGLRTLELRPWFDVDDPAALRRLLSGDADGYPAPHTRAAMAAFDLSRRVR